LETRERECLDFQTHSLFNDVAKKDSLEMINIMTNVWLTLHVGISDTGRAPLL
jgi:hypothetical protein